MTRNVTRIATATLLALALGFLSIPAARADDAAALYKTKCAACHGPDGSGSTATGKTLGTPDFRSDDVQKQTDAQLTDATANGKRRPRPVKIAGY